MSRTGLSGTSDAWAGRNGSRLRSSRRHLCLLILSLLLAISTVPTAAEPAAIDGAPGLGDPYYPRLGNAGYDVRHYDVALQIDPRRRSIEGSTTIDLVPTATLRSFTLDFVGFNVSGVDVDGIAARFSREDHKLRVEPQEPLAKETSVVVRIEYAGKPNNPSATTGWIWFGGGGALFAPQPSGSRTLFPCNDHPSDKATFAFDLTTPHGVTAVANGLPSAAAAEAGFERVVWREPAPFPSYAAVVAVGQFALVRESGPGGLPIINALPPQHAARLGERLQRQGEIVAVLADYLGPYPYSSIGAIVTGEARPDAMEAASRPTYPGIQWALHGGGFEQVVAHEIAHQWLGNTVTAASWQDIWLNEGFATYGELLWLAHARGVPIATLFARDSDVFRYAPAMKTVPPGDPGANHLFNISVYNRGALTLEALRRTVGDDTFYRILRAHVDRSRGETTTTADFIELAESISGQDLDRFFQRWLYARGLPPLPPERAEAP